MTKPPDKASMPAATVYITNAVKHFSWEPRGKRRIHKTPAQREVAACEQWLDAEIAAVRPRVIVALGAVAPATVSDRADRVMGENCRARAGWVPPVQPVFACRPRPTREAPGGAVGRRR
jgi:DNA polymerase